MIIGQLHMIMSFRLTKQPSESVWTEVREHTQWVQRTEQNRLTACHVGKQMA